MRSIAVVPPIPIPKRERERRRRAYAAAANADIAVDVRTLAGGPPLTDREYELFWATVYVILEAERAEAGGAAGILLDCTADPGFVEVSQSVSIPVAGALHSGVAAALDATGGAGPFSVLALDEHWARMLRERLHRYRLDSALATVEAVGMHVYTVETAPAGNRGELAARLIGAGRAALEAGARALLLGSTTIVDEVEALRNELQVPVIAPGIAALRDLQTTLSDQSGKRRPAGAPRLPPPVFRHGATIAALLDDR